MANKQDIFEIINGSNMDQLNEIKKSIFMREMEIRRENGKVNMKKIFMGAYVVFEVGKEKRVGKVQTITEDFVGVRNEDSTRGRARRLAYDEILEISEEPISLEKEPEAPKKKGKKKAE